MTPHDEHPADALIDAYLDRLRDALAEAPSDQRHQVMGEIEQHISDALSAAPDRSRATVERVLRELGAPEDIAKELQGPVEKRGRSRQAVAAMCIALAALAVAVGASTLVLVLVRTDHSVASGATTPAGTTEVGYEVTKPLPNAVSELALQYLTASCRAHGHERPPWSRVTSQRPASGNVALGSVVHLTIRTARRTSEALVLAPGTVGYPLSCATLWLHSLGFTVHTAYVGSTQPWPRGTVISQAPRNGTRLHVGAVVSVVVQSATVDPHLGGGACNGTRLWQTQGTRLVNFYRAIGATSGGHPSGGVWAYPSLPIAVQGDGVRTLYFGPVPASFRFGSTPGEVHAWSTQGPPAFAGSVGPGFTTGVRSIRYVLRDGHHYVAMTMRLSSVTARCSGLTVWLY